MNQQCCGKSAAENDKTGGSLRETTRGGGRYFRPAVDIVENEGELVVIADVPGSKAEEIDIKFENGALSVLAPVKERDVKGKSLHREYEVGSYFRSFQIGEGIDPSRISAQYQNGVLTLTLPKSEATKSRRIPVQ